jgi:hypothetical protein
VHVFIYFSDKFNKPQYEIVFQKRYKELVEESISGNGLEKKTMCRRYADYQEYNKKSLNNGKFTLDLDKLKRNIICNVRFMSSSYSI